MKKVKVHIQIAILYCHKVFLNATLTIVLLWKAKKIYRGFRKEVQVKKFRSNSQKNNS